ncbi:MAG: flagellar protein [Lachnospiraceae bacterium]|nr:flagellar protein [Lachnospiraceae bacterium]
MNVRNCRRCKRLFNYVFGPPICPDCQRKEEEIFQEVKKYVEDNRGASIATVSTECGVDIQQIQKWVREERLEFAEGGPSGITCEKCGAPINTGRFCKKCKAEVVDNLSSAMPKKKMPEQKKNTKESPKMRFLQ